MSVSARCGAVLAMVLLSACTGTTPVTPTPTLSPTATTPGPTSRTPQATPTPPITAAPPTITPSITPTVTPAMSGESPSPSGLVSTPRVIVTSSEPVVRASHLGPYLAVLPAAYFVDGGTRHAYLVGFGEARGDQRVFHATSSDGLDWSVDSADPFVELGLDLSPPGPVPTSVLPAGDGSWVMFLWGTPAPQFEGGEIWRATAPSPAGPWTADPEPVLTPGPTGAWDDRFVDFPAVVPTTVGHSMLYSAVGFGNPQTTSIGLATSADGVTWERRPEPVIEMGMCGDEPYAAAPRLIALDDGFLVLYDAGRQTVAARSVNLVDWTCVSDGPVLTAADVPGSTGIHTIAATLADERVSLFVESLTGSSGGSELWLAEESGLR